MADDILDPVEIAIKTFGSSGQVMIGNAEITYTLSVASPDVRESARLIKTIVNLIEQSLAFIQHVDGSNHENRECLAQAFKLGGPDNQSEEDAKIVEMLAKSKNLPRA